jgi:hypothetical protein
MDKAARRNGHLVTTTLGPSVDRTVAPDQRESAVESTAQRERISARLGENEATLDTGKSRGGEPRGVCIRPELAGLDHGRDAGADTRLPTVEPRSEHGPDAVVTLTELAEEIGNRAASLTAPLLLQGNKRVGPLDQSIPGVEAVKEVALAVENDAVGGFGDRQQKVVLIVEVVVELATRGRGPGTNLVQARPERPLLGDHLGRRGHDALTGKASPVGAWLRSHCPPVSRQLDLTVQSSCVQV